MIRVEMRLKAIDDELAKIDALVNAPGYRTTPLVMYAVGVRDTLEWIKNGGESPSQNPEFPVFHGAKP